MAKTSLQEKLQNNYSAAKGGAVSNLNAAQQQMEKNKANFLKLFTTQMTHQNPLQPADSSDMYNQIAQLNQLEQQLEANKMLSNINDSLQTQMFNSAYSNLLLEGLQDDIGAIKGDMIGLAPGDSGLAMHNGSVRMPYNILQNDMVSAKLRIENEYGSLLFENDVDPRQGAHTFNWNGLDRNGNQVTDFSKLRYRVIVKDGNGQSIAAITPLTTQDTRSEQLRNYRNTIDKLTKTLHETSKNWINNNA